MCFVVQQIVQYEKETIYSSTVGWVLQLPLYDGTMDFHLVTIGAQ
jgi:hypothetical protein